MGWVKRDEPLNAIEHKKYPAMWKEKPMEWIKQLLQRWIDRKTESIHTLCMQMTEEIDHIKDEETRRILQERIEQFK